MEQTFTGTDKVGDIVSAFPKAGEIFKRNAIDFCCGGNRPLSQAIKEKDLNESAILKELNESYLNRKQALGQDADVDWKQASLTTLIDHIVDTHHSFLKKELPELGELVTTILRVHGAKTGDVLGKVHRLFHTLKMDMEQHLIKEEEVLFPLIKEYEKEPTQRLLEKVLSTFDEIEKEHEQAGDILKELRSVTNQYEIPADVCNTFILTYSKLEELESDLFKHIHLENNILSPRLRNNPMSAH